MEWSHMCRSLLCNGTALKGEGGARPLIRKWLEVCPDDAMKAVAQEAGIICRSVVGDAMSSSSTAEALLPMLMNGIKKVQPTEHHMTPFHPAVLQAYVLLTARIRFFRRQGLTKWYKS
jgi:hypothetical protein